MLVVADQGARIVGRQCSSCRCPRAPKKIAEYRRFGPTLAEACIGKTFARRQHKVQIAEKNALLDLAGIKGCRRSATSPLGEIDENEGLRVDPVELRYGEEVWGVQDREGRPRNSARSVTGGTNEHCLRENRLLPGAVGHHPDGQAVGWGRFRRKDPGQRARRPLKVSQHAMAQTVEALGKRPAG